MVVKNASKTIERAINSTRGVCNEFIVVDFGSTDGTAALARELGAEVFFFESSKDLASAKNYSLKHAAGEWALILEQDEWVLPHAQDRLFESIMITPLKVEGLIFSVKTFADNKNQALLLRAVRLLDSIKFVDSMSPRPINLKERRGIYSLPVPIIEGSILAKGIPEKENDSELEPEVELYDIAVRALLAKDYNTAFSNAERFIFKGEFSAQVNIDGFAVAFIASLKLEIKNKILENLLKIMNQRFPSHPVTHYILSIVAYNNRDYLRAIRFFEHAEHMQTSPYALKSIGKSGIDLLIDEYRITIAKLYIYKKDTQSAYNQLCKLAKCSKDRLAVLPEILRMIKDDSLFLKLVSEVYITDDRIPITSLLDVLASHEPGYAYLAVYEKWSEVHKEPDEHFGLMLCVLGRLPAAYRVFMAVYSDTGNIRALLRAAACAIVANDENLLDDIFARGTNSLRRILNSLCELEGENPTENDEETLLGVLREMLNLKKVEGATAYAIMLAHLACDVGIKTCFESARLLFIHGHYEHSRLLLLAVVRDTSFLNTFYNKSLLCDASFMLASAEIVLLHKNSAARHLYLAAANGLCEQKLTLALFALSESESDQE